MHLEKSIDDIFFLNVEIEKMIDFFSKFDFGEFNFMKI
jgi:hypothetical protein